MIPERRRRPLTMEDREEISRGLAKGLEYKDIAASIRRDESVVSREISRHGGPAGYRAWKAGAAARESRSRPKERKIDQDPELRERVVRDLRDGWSPEEISGRLATSEPGERPNCPYRTRPSTPGSTPSPKGSSRERDLPADRPGGTQAARPAQDPRRPDHRHDLGR